MKLFLLNLLLSVAWAALTGNFVPINLLFGFVLAYGLLWIAMRDTKSARYFRRVPQVIEFAGFFLLELLTANIRMLRTVLSRRLLLQPAVVGVPLDLRNDAAISLLMNLITLTPGTLSMDVSSDRKILFIHSIWVEDEQAFSREIKNGFERRVKELFE